jgi:integrase
VAAIVKGKNPNRPWTVRYRDSQGSQREKSFKTKGEAQAFITDHGLAKRYGHDVNVASAKKPFNDAVETWLANLRTVSPQTREQYTGIYRTWVKPAYAGKTVQDASTQPAIAETLLNKTMDKLSKSRRVMVRLVITGTLDSLVRDGTILAHRCVGLKLADPPVTEDDSEDGGFVHLTDEQVAKLAGKVGIAVWLQRCMGLRIREALGVEKKDFTHDGKILRLRWQSGRDGKTRVPLKHRAAKQGRDIPVPAFIWNMVKDMPDGPLMPAPVGAGST